MVRLTPLASLSLVLGLLAVITPSSQSQSGLEARRNRSKVVTISQSACSTIKGSGNAVKPLPTKSSATTVHDIIKVIYRTTLTTSVTPAPSTVISTATSTITTTTTDPAITDTLTVSERPTTRFTETATVTSTATADGGTVTTTTTATTTIPALAGFTPLASQISAAGQTPAYRRSLATSAPGVGSLLARKQQRQNAGFCDKKGKALQPKSVTCRKRVEVLTYTQSTVTAKKQETVTVPAQTATSTTTVQTTTTETSALPQVSVTTTTTLPVVTQTVTTTTTATTTTTTTATATASATATDYEACRANNFVDKINGRYVSGGDGSGDCYTFTPLPGGTCPVRYTLDTSESRGLEDSFAVGNGACGTWSA
ncbi:hypothetical protein CBOM_01744 [Ceraceosorus bombacis]|uniref:Uncharacterized protein n=1 Tax=Ceraceosorus bombacis TaxID=401625 RepID=A0A0N7L9I1_9BASI|nr:hypothetical protein CBOM_01744 [Ceraceosorus bombacis]